MFCTRVAWVCLVCLLLCKEECSLQLLREGISMESSGLYNCILCQWSCLFYMKKWILMSLFLCAFQVVGDFGVHLQSNLPFHKYAKQQVCKGKWRRIFPGVVLDRRTNYQVIGINYCNQ